MTHSTQAINGEIACFDLVISTGNSKYPFLVGEVNAVDKLGSAEHHSGNQTDDVFVDFQAEVYSERRVAEIEAHFSKLHGEPKRFEDIPLYNVLMPPNSLIRISESDVPMLLESRENAEAFCNRVLNKEKSNEKRLTSDKPRKPSILGQLQDGKKAAAQSEPKTPTKKTEKEI